MQDVYECMDVLVLVVQYTACMHVRVYALVHTHVHMSLHVVQQSMYMCVYMYM